MMVDDDRVRYECGLMAHIMSLTVKFIIVIIIVIIHGRGVNLTYIHSRN